MATALRGLVDATFVASRYAPQPLARGSPTHTKLDDGDCSQGVGGSTGPALPRRPGRRSTAGQPSPNLCSSIINGLRVPVPDVVAMQTRQPNLEGAGEIPLRRLVKEALRMRPSRIVVG